MGVGTTILWISVAQSNVLVTVFVILSVPGKKKVFFFPLQTLSGFTLKPVGKDCVRLGVIQRQELTREHEREKNAVKSGIIFESTFWLLCHWGCGVAKQQLFSKLCLAVISIGQVLSIIQIFKQPYYAKKRYMIWEINQLFQTPSDHLFDLL